MRGEKGWEEGARKRTRKTLILVPLWFRYSLVAFQLARIWGFSSLFPPIAVFSAHLSEVIKGLRSLRKKRKTQKSSLLSKEKVNKVFLRPELALHPPPKWSHKSLVQNDLNSSNGWDLFTWILCNDAENDFPQHFICNGKPHQLRTTFRASM